MGGDASGERARPSPVLLPEAGQIRPAHGLAGLRRRREGLRELPAAHLQLLEYAVAKGVAEIGIRPVELLERFVVVRRGEARVGALGETRLGGRNDIARLRPRDDRDAFP